MAVPSSGQLSLLAIYNELAENDYSSGTSRTNVSLEDLSEGTVATINTANASADRPDGSNPHAMTEFYAYDHDLAGVQPPSNVSHFAISTTSTKLRFTEPTDGTRVFYTQGSQASFTIFNDEAFEVDGVTNITTDENGTVFEKTISHATDKIYNPTLSAFTAITLQPNDFFDIKLRGRDGASGTFSSTVTHRAWTAPDTPGTLSSSFLQTVAGINGSGSNDLTGTVSWAQPTGGASSYKVIYGSSTSETHADNTTITGITVTSASFALPNFATRYWWVQGVGGGNDTGSLSSRQTFNGGQLTRLPYIENRSGFLFPGTQTLTCAISSGGGPAATEVETGQLTFSYSGNTLNDSGGEFDVVISIISGVGSGHTFTYGASLSSGAPTTSIAEGTTTTLTGAFGDTVYLNFGFVTVSSDSAGFKNRTCRVQVGSAFRDILIQCEATSGSGPGKSDRRLKTNINRIKTSPSGIPVYQFRFKDDLDTLWEGVIAQDLLEMGMNEVVGTDENGFYTVDYNKIDVDQIQIAEEV